MDIKRIAATVIANEVGQEFYQALELAIHRLNFQKPDTDFRIRSGLWDDDVFSREIISVSERGHITVHARITMDLKTLEITTEEVDD